MPVDREVDETLDCELCVLGAGIAGLNALHSASTFLRPQDRVVLVDRHGGPGGMWNDTYPFVRLHQPHPMFTVGNIPWQQRLPPAYLADRTQVQAQLAHCLDQLARRVSLHTRFGHQYLEHREDGEWVDIALRPVTAGPPLRIRARRLIKAFGSNVSPTRPLRLSSPRVHSLTPHDVAYFGAEMASSDAPIYVVGGGKSGMDAAHELRQRLPHRELRMLTGEGVMFANRDRIFAQGMRRWFGGVAPFEVFLDVARHFDGGNVEQANRYLLQRYGLALGEDPKQYQLGILSAAELAVIRDGVSQVIEDYLQDVADTATGPELRLRGGGSQAVAAGSWFVNCTGYIARERAAFEPYVSASGRVLSINTSSATFFLGSFGGYFLTHLMYRDRLLDVPLYSIDSTELSAKRKSALGLVGITSTLLNVLHLMQALPARTFEDCRLDFNRWYPLPRRLSVVLRLRLHHARHVARFRAALDRLARESGIKRMGVLPHVAAGSHARAA